MGALAGRPFEPAKRSAIHGRHRELGANIQLGGRLAPRLRLRRPRGRGDGGPRRRRPDRRLDARQAARPRARRRRAARPPLPEPDVEPEAGPHPLRRADVATPGRITDDGTVCRLDDETFYVTTTSERRRRGRAVVHVVARRLGHATSHITDVTQGLGGDEPRRPARARDPRRADRRRLLGRGLHLPRRPARARSPACRAWSCGSASSASSATRSTAPRRTREHLWDALMQAGASAASRPFGLEPQRILRLQKLHILVGQDTDSESTPYGAAMPWIVKLDKEQDFIGRWALEHAAEQPAADRARRLHAARRRRARPRARWCSTSGGAPVGQVTSARRSPQLGKVDRHGLGAGRAGRGRRADHDLRRRAARTTRPSRPGRSTTPKGRCCAHEPRLPRPSRAGAGRAAGARSPMERHGARRRRDARGARRLGRRRRASATRGEAPRATRRLRRRLAPAQARAAGPTPLGSCRPGIGDARPTAAGTARSRRRARSCSAARSAERPWTSLDVTTSSARCASPARWRGRRSPASARSTCARRRTPVRGASARARSRARPGFVLREDDDRYLVLVGAAYGEYLWDRRRRRRRASRRRPGRRRRDCRRAEEAARCVTSSASAACGGRARSSRTRYDVVIIGGGSHGLATAYYLGSTASPTSPCSRRATSAPARPGATRRSCARTTRRPRARASTTRRVKLYEGLGAGARLQPAVQPVRPSDARALRPRDVRDGQPRRGQPPQRHRLAADRRPTRCRSWRRRCTSATTRRIRSWARSTTRPAASSATTRSSGASRAAPTRAAPRSTRTPRSPASSARATASPRSRRTAARSRPGTVLNCTAGWSTLISDMAGVPLPITTHILQACVTEPVKPFLDVVDRLLADARLHLPVRPRRVRDGLGDRAVDDVPHAGHAELPPGPHRATRSSCSRSSSTRACCGPGPGCATSAPTTARSSARPRSRTSTSAPAGARTASRRRRSSARRSPSSSRPGRTPDLIAPFALERFYKDKLVSELAAAAVSH